ARPGRPAVRAPSTRVRRHRLGPQAWVRPGRQRARPPARSPDLGRDRARDQADFEGAGLLPRSPCGPERAGVRDDQVPDDVCRRGRAAGRAGGGGRGGGRAVQAPGRSAGDGGRSVPAAALARRGAAGAERAPRRDEPGRAAGAPASRLRASRALAPQALSRSARDDRPLADRRPLRPRLRRSRPARLLLPGELVDLAGHLDPAAEDPRGDRGPRGLLTRSIIVVAYHSGEALGRLLASLEGEDVVVVDNGGDVAERDGVTVVRPGENLGFAAGNNVGARQASGEALVFLNPAPVGEPGAPGG